MKGNVYSRQKCSVCSGRFVHDEKRGGCFCEKHPQICATGQFYISFGRDINKRFPTYEKAIRYLNGLRYDTDQGKYDVRDHLASNPLGFNNLAKDYLTFKERQNLKSFYHIKRYINQAAEYFGGRNVKHIKKRDIRAFLYSLDVSEKTRANYASQLHDMVYNWLYGEEELISLADLPKFPTIKYELGFRKIIGVQDREKIIDKLKKKTYADNPKIWLAVDMLCSYNKLRPMDLRNIKEGDLDLEFGIMTIWRPTKSQQNKRPKVIREPLLGFHMDEIRDLKRQYPALPATPFFRHNGKNQAAKDTPFGINYLYKQWKKICKDMGIDDLDLYGATRHSTTTAIAAVAGKAKARKSSGHGTNKAFDRYCQIADEDSQEMTLLMAKMRGKIIPMEEKKEREK